MAMAMEYLHGPIRMMMIQTSKKKVVVPTGKKMKKKVNHVE